MYKLLQYISRKQKRLNMISPVPFLLTLNFYLCDVGWFAVDTDGKAHVYTHVWKPRNKCSSNVERWTKFFL